ncbi:Pyruvate decarboxylase; Alpha-keto-acid decarboxylase [Asaia bogorensis]|uniref:Pyruvate decarboxylase Alpha-keto-acid decarboxylase n=2 Tax=Acetobacteraceae TaxID=433 RepID=A0A060QHN0_9PROT|nr:Pyruvate decarboxylase; Alpha-keto-acid decarboxylase [Asaia bogorensis]
MTGLFLFDERQAMSVTVIEHLLNRVADLGIRHVFGVAGDYAFPIEDAVCARDDMTWVGSCNELNAAYSADGYARVNGVAALSTTFGVGELSALNGVAGAFAERLPIVHIVGMPASSVLGSDKLVHHSLANGNFLAFYNAAADFTCARVILTPENCIQEVERAIHAMRAERRPIYFGIPSDIAGKPVVVAAPLILQPAQSCPDALGTVIARILASLEKSARSCVLPGILAARFGNQARVQDFLDRTVLPHATMFADKSVVRETAPHYLGLYYGHLLHENIADFLEGCDLVLGIGMQQTDFNTGAFTAKLSEEHLINIMPDHVVFGHEIINGVMMHDVLDGLCAQADTIRRFEGELPVQARPVAGNEPFISSATLYHDLQSLIRPDDIIAAETGNASMGMAEIRLPEDVSYHNQTLWGSIGWATPASFGMAMAASSRRVILVTGEGSHQLTAQELSQFGRFRKHPVVVVINNDGYLIERLLCKDGETYYNDLAQWRYHLLPAALGCDDWAVSTVSTRDELEAAFAACNADTSRGHFIEVRMRRYDAAPVALAMHDAVGTLYGN